MELLTLDEAGRVLIPQQVREQLGLKTQSSALRVRQLLLDGNRQDRTGLTGSSSGDCFEQAQD